MHWCYRFLLHWCNRLVRADVRLIGGIGERWHGQHPVYVRASGPLDDLDQAGSREPAE